MRLHRSSAHHLPRFPTENGDAYDHAYVGPKGSATCSAQLTIGPLPVAGHCTRQPSQPSIARRQCLSSFTCSSSKIARGLSVAPDPAYDEKSASSWSSGAVEAAFTSAAFGRAITEAKFYMRYGDAWETAYLIVFKYCFVAASALWMTSAIRRTFGAR